MGETGVERYDTSESSEQPHTTDLQESHGARLRASIFESSTVVDDESSSGTTTVVAWRLHSSELLSQRLDSDVEVHALNLCTDHGWRLDLRGTLDRVVASEYSLCLQRDRCGRVRRVQKLGTVARDRLQESHVVGLPASISESSTVVDDDESSFTTAVAAWRLYSGEALSEHLESDEDVDLALAAAAARARLLLRFRRPGDLPRPLTTEGKGFLPSLGRGGQRVALPV
ncbi:hypothetical protein MRX96_024286 [Rhipicephalus microplus]